jgi:single-strand DNA-binding protein
MVNMQAIGHLGKDVNVKEANGKQVLNFSIAHTESWKDSQGVKKEKTLWVDCAWWTESKNIAQYLTKGAQVYVSGTPSIRVWESEKTDKHGASLELRVFNLQLLGSKKEASGEGVGNGVAQPQVTDGTTGMPVDDLPF